MNTKKCDILVKDVIYKHLIYNPTLKVIFLPVLLFYFFTDFVHKLIMKSITNIELFDYCSTTKTAERVVFEYMYYTTVHYTLDSIYEILLGFYANSVIHECIRSFLLDYISLNHDVFHKIGSGEVSCLIERRTKAVTELLKTFTLKLIKKMSFLIVTLVFIKKNFKSSIFMVFLIMSVFFIGLYIPLSFFMERRRRRINNKHYELNSRIYEIIKNREIILAYGSFEEEKNYCWTQGQYVVDELYMFKTLCNLISLVKIMALFLFNALVIYFGLTDRFFTVLNDFSIMSLYYKYFDSLKGELYSLDKDIFTLFKSFTDVIDVQVRPEDTLKDDEIIGMNHLNMPIVMKDVSITVNEVLILKDINLSIEKGEKIAIVGKNGTGKSSFVNVLLKFIRYKGSIKVDNLEYRNIDKRCIRQLISYVPQSSNINNITVLENLKYADERKCNTKVRNTCVMYGVHDSLSSLSYGYDTVVGESGGHLSGGQRQLLSFMRGIIKDSEFFIFDEFSSNLDRMMEDRLMFKFFNELKNRTVLAILHNFKYLEHFDKIFGFQNNTIKVYYSFNEFLKDIEYY